MLWRIPVVTALAVFLAVGCDQGPTAVEEVTVVAPSLKAEPSHNRFIIEDEFTGFIPCGGANELVDFTVNGACQWQAFFDANGGLHNEGVCNVHGKGYGQTSGSKWIFSEVWPTTIHIGPNTEYPYTYNDVYISLWQGTGGAPSWNDWYHTKYTINANGEMTVEIESHRYVCEGL